MVRMDLILAGGSFTLKKFYGEHTQVWNHTHPKQHKLFFQNHNYSSEDKIIPDTLV